MTEQEFRLRADETLEELQQQLLPLADEADLEIDLRNGVLQLVFEEPTPAKFVVSPNAPVQQIWVSALSRSYKLAWSEDAATFELWGGLVHGGRCVVSRERVPTAGGLRELVRSGGVTTMWLTPFSFNFLSTLRMLPS